jgi:hypothetical protein
MKIGAHRAGVQRQQYRQAERLAPDAFAPGSPYNSVPVTLR